MEVIWEFYRSCIASDIKRRNVFFHSRSATGFVDVEIDECSCVAAKYQKTASQIVLRWIVQRGLITIPRAKPNHFRENMEILTFSLSDEDMKAISALNQNMRSNVLNDPETFPW